MLIDWFTIFAQLLNFLILVFLLKHFLYDRIIEAMDKREENIAARMEEADKKQKEAEIEAASYNKRKEELESRKEQIISEARDEAEQERGKILHEGREEAEILRNKLHDSIENEKESFLSNIRSLSVKEFYSFSRRALLCNGRLSS